MINGQPVVEAQEKITIELTIDQKSEVQTMLYIQGSHGCRGEGGGRLRGENIIARRVLSVGLVQAFMH